MTRENENGQEKNESVKRNTRKNAYKTCSIRYSFSTIKGM